MPGRRRQQSLERVLGTPALFATAYGNVGSSVYYALGLTAVYALGLTPIVFIVAGLIFACTAATYSEGTVRYPEAGGSASFARHAFDERVSFTAAWAQMLVYVVTVAVSAFFVPHYLSIFWDPLRTNPWDIVGGAIVIVILVALNVVGVSEAAKLSVTLAVVDLATQVLLVIIGFALVFNPGTLVDNVHWGVAPTWSNLALAVPVAMLAYTGVETVSNLAEEVRDPIRSVPKAYKLVAVAVFAIYFTLPWIALSAMPVTRNADGEYETLLGLPRETTFIGTLYAFGATLSFTVAHVSLIRIRRLRKDETEVAFRARPNLRARGVDWPLFAIVGGLATGASWLVIVVQNPTTRWVGLGWIAAGLVFYALYRRYSVHESLAAT